MAFYSRNITSATRGKPQQQSCGWNFDNIHQLATMQKNILSAMHLTSAIVVFVLNVTVIFLIIKTKQHNIQSFKITLLSSITYCCLAVFGQTMIPVSAAGFYRTWPCSVQILTNIPYTLFFQLQFMLSNLIGIDRYLHIRYPNRYSTIYSPIRFRLSILAVVMLSIFQTILFTVSIKIIKWRTPLLLFPVAITTMSVTFYFHLKSLKLLKHQQKRRQHFERVQRDITLLAKRYLYSFTIFVVLGMGCVFFSGLVIGRFVDRKTTMFIVSIFLWYALCQSMVNAIIFITTNRKSKSYIRKRIKNQVAPINTDFVRPSSKP